MSLSVLLALEMNDAKCNKLSPSREINRQIVVVGSIDSNFWHFDMTIGFRKNRMMNVKIRTECIIKVCKVFREPSTGLPVMALVSKKP